MGVKKDLTETLFCGKEWKCFIIEKRLHGGEIIHFNMAVDVPLMTILYIYSVCDEEEKFEEDDEEDEENEEEGGALANNLFSQRCNLTHAEYEQLLEILLPPNTFIRMPFVTRLTSIHVNKSPMVHSFNLSLYFLFVVSMHKL
jgi:hypothetical protein